MEALVRNGLQCKRPQNNIKLPCEGIVMTANITCGISLLSVQYDFVSVQLEVVTVTSEAVVKDSTQINFCSFPQELKMRLNQLTTS